MGRSTYCMVDLQYRGEEGAGPIETTRSVSDLLDAPWLHISVSGCPADSTRTHVGEKMLNRVFFGKFENHTVGDLRRLLSEHAEKAFARVLSIITYRWGIHPASGPIKVVLHSDDAVHQEVQLFQVSWTVEAANAQDRITSTSQ